MTALLLAVALGQADASVSAAPWTAVDTRGAFTLFTRSAGEHGFSEYKVEVETDLPVALLCEVVFEWGSKATDYPGVTSRRLLKDEPDERITHDTLKMPVISDREYVMKIVRSRGADGSCHLHYFATDELAPKKSDAVVRIEALRGEWSFEPKGEKTRLTYTLFAEPGGAIPAFLVGATQRQNAYQSVTMALQRARLADGGKK